MERHWRISSRGMTLTGLDFLAIMSNAAVNIHVHRVYSCVVLYRHMFLLLSGIYLGVELLCHLEILFHILKKCQSVLESGSYHFTAPSAV